ncbi:MAG: hypothetical protein PHH28_07355 [Desulfuromonadaceae bacterium]|nr:hypothetical protein [Desulfuromonadaceae bacterium]
MIISQRYAGILILQLIFLLLLIAFRADHVSHLAQDDNDAIDVHNSLDLSDFNIETANNDDDILEAAHISSPEYSTNSIVTVPSLPSGSGRLYLEGRHPYFPIIYLPVFSPPKIRA